MNDKEQNLSLIDHPYVKLFGIILAIIGVLPIIHSVIDFFFPNYLEYLGLSSLKVIVTNNFLMILIVLIPIIIILLIHVIKYTKKLQQKPRRLDITRDNPQIMLEKRNKILQKNKSNLIQDNKITIILLIILILFNVLVLVFNVSFIPSSFKNNTNVIDFFSLSVIAFVYFISLSPIDINYPGEKAIKLHKKSDQTDLFLEKNFGEKLKYDSQDVKVSLITEDTIARKIGEAKWEISIFLTILNNEDSAITLYDIHANTYCSLANIVSPASILERWYIELYENNSIIESGKTLQIKSKSNYPINVKFNISRLRSFGIKSVSPSEGMIFSIFGLFIDYHIVDENNDVINYRIPSDSIYCFQNDNNGENSVWINLGNINFYHDYLKGSHRGRQLVDGFVEALEKHISTYYKVKPMKSNTVPIKNQSEK